MARNFEIEEGKDMARSAEDGKSQEIGSDDAATRKGGSSPQRLEEL